jgi:hypothetical protein
MSTARTHITNVGARPLGVARPLEGTPKPDDFAPVSAETFLEEGTGFATIEGDQADSADPDFDPADHTVDEVKAYIEEHPEQTDAILELEEEGKARVSLLSLAEEE